MKPGFNTTVIIECNYLSSLQLNVGSILRKVSMKVYSMFFLMFFLLQFLISAQRPAAFFMSVTFYGIWSLFLPSFNSTSFVFPFLLVVMLCSFLSFPLLSFFFLSMHFLLSCPKLIKCVLSSRVGWSKLWSRTG